MARFLLKDLVGRIIGNAVVLKKAQGSKNKSIQQIVVDHPYNMGQCPYHDKYTSIEYMAAVQMLMKITKPPSLANTRPHNKRN
ncbi:MAG TPA: hypothetical protein VJZ92_02595 [Thermodesulfobacteriota bacterium]|nr:hypothetical protein [Thermodesulfobacteriota bacterium]